MHIVFTPNGLEDYRYWKKHHPEMITRIQKLLERITKDPYKGVGKPEPLRYSLSGLWSRRITREHRLVYQVKNDTLIIHQCRYHY